MNILLVIYNKDIENPDVFKDRIKTLGDTFYIFDNMVLVETVYNTKEAYEKLSVDAYEKSSMLILYVWNEMLGFWGRMNVKLWTWLDERKGKTKGGLEQNYIDEIHELALQVEKLKLENKSLSQQKESLEKKLKERND